MATKRKKQHGFVDDGRDKPDYAADLFRKEQPGKQDSRKKQSANQTEDKGPTVAESLNGELANRLAQMKQALLDEDAKREAAKVTSKQPQRQAAKGQGTSKSVRRREEPDQETASFAELFDPTPEDEESFEEMLKDSKLDWQKFKE